MTFRLLVCGSRIWADQHLMENVLADLAWDRIDVDKLTIVEGCCPTGADHMAEEWAKDASITLEHYPANWGVFGRRAGFIRNQEMVDAGADLCVAFITGESKGSRHTLVAAKAAGIPTLLLEKT